MRAPHWLRHLAACLNRTRDSRPPRRPAFRPRLEPLENRATPAVALASAFGIGSSGYDTPTDIATDPAGNVYMTGAFTGDVDFDPGPGQVTLSSPTWTDPSTGDSYRLSAPFVAKYAPDGALVWARGGVNLATPGGERIVADGSGNVYLAGIMNGTVDFGTDAAGNPVVYTSRGSDDGYVAKLDASGNLLWARFMGGSGLDRAWGLATDGSGNVVTVGEFWQNASFGNTTLTANGKTGFICKLDPAGNFTWVKQVGGGGRAVAIDGSGGVHVTGEFAGKVDFDPGPGTFLVSAGQGPGAAFVVKLGAGGQFQWAGAFQSSKWSVSRGERIAVDAAGNVYVAGEFGGTVDFNPGTGKYSLTSTGTGENDCYVCKLDSAGRFVWAKKWGGQATYDSVGGLALDAAGGVYISGSFGGTVDFNPGPGTYTLAAGSGYNAYVLKLTSAGDFVWAAGLGGGGGVGIALDGSGNVYTTGGYDQVGDFDPDPASNYYLPWAGSVDIFLVKLWQD